MPALLLIALATASPACVARVSDGDTIRLCSGERVRLLGIDAPERKGSERCSARSRARLKHSPNPSWCDFEMGERARAALTRLIGTGTVRIERRGHDVYGRTLARVTVNGRDAGEWLIGKGLARPWR
ncbi:MAG: thermonuclease family protein [Novosphingobium sp.]